MIGEELSGSGTVNDAPSASEFLVVAREISMAGLTTTHDVHNRH